MSDIDQYFFPSTPILCVLQEGAITLTQYNTYSKITLGAEIVRFVELSYITRPTPPDGNRVVKRALQADNAIGGIASPPMWKVLPDRDTADWAECVYNGWYRVAAVRLIQPLIITTP